MTAKDLRQQFQNEEGISWENPRGEPYIDYVMWLERKVLRRELIEIATENSTEEQLWRDIQERDKEQ